MSEAKLAKNPAPGRTVREFKNYIFTYIKENKKGKVTLFPPTVDIPEEDEVYMTFINKSGEQVTELRSIRYSRGESSIFVDEQSEGADKRRGHIKLTEGVLIVNEKETNLLKYLELCNYNSANSETRMEGKPVIFRIDAKGYKADQALKLEEQKARLKNIIFNMEDEECVGLGLSLGLPYLEGRDKIKELKKRFIDMINYDAARFERELESDVRKLKVILVKAITMDIISVDKHTNTIYNEIGGKTKIMDVPPYKDAIDTFVELAQIRDEYKVAFDDIKKLVSTTGFKKGASGAYRETEELELLNKARGLGLIKNSFGKISMTNVGQLGATDKEVVTFLRSSPAKLKKFKELIEAAEKDKK